VLGPKPLPPGKPGPGPKEKIKAPLTAEDENEGTVMPVALAAPDTYSNGAVEALAEVNASRAGAGLPPFIRDEGLTLAAASAAGTRARLLMEGHTPNDFVHLQYGSHAHAAGCGACPQGTWASCCVYDQHRYAGAAYAVGRDGRRYCHIFVKD
jgi:hypothetical protein